MHHGVSSGSRRRFRLHGRRAAPHPGRATPRSRSCTSTADTQRGRGRGGAVPESARRLRAPPVLAARRRGLGRSRPRVLPRCRTARARRCCPTCSTTSVTPSTSVPTSGCRPTCTRAGTASRTTRPSSSIVSRTGSSSCTATRSPTHTHVAAPGCYPTAVSLACAPLVALDLVEPRIVADAVSGVSGAGRGLKTTSLFSEANENVSAYGLLTHRHTAEMEQTPHEGRRPRRERALHAAPRPDRRAGSSRRVTHARRRRVCRPRGCSSTTASSMRTIRASSSSTSRREPRQPTAPTSRTSRCASTPAPTPWSRSRRRTIS